jgi:hypothetical protein
MGPMTGRAAGYCGRYPAFGNAADAMPKAGSGGGRIFGRGGGSGWRNQFYATGLAGWQRGGWGAGFPGVSQEGELNALKGQAGHLAESLSFINRRIQELEEKDRAN